MNRLKELASCFIDHPRYCGSVVVLVVAGLILLHYIYMAVFPIRTLEINTEVAPVTSKQVYPGDTLEYMLDFCSYTQREAKVFYRMVDGFVYTLPAVETSTPPSGCFNSAIRSVTIPENTPAGTYYLESEVVIYVNSIRQDVVQYRTEAFEVLPE